MGSFKRWFEVAVMNSTGQPANPSATATDAANIAQHFLSDPKNQKDAGNVAQDAAVKGDAGFLQTTTKLGMKAVQRAPKSLAMQTAATSKNVGDQIAKQFNPSFRPGI